MHKRILCLILMLAMTLNLFPAMAAEAKPSGAPLSVVYIPLDDRPFNDARMKALAKSLNIDLIMPDQDLYATRLDGQGEDGNCQYGDREALLAWLQTQAKTHDTFILSMDQLLSGGLMNSRCMWDAEDLLLEYEIIDAVAELAEDESKCLYIIDSVMRLTTSCDYANYNLDHYNAFSAYGQIPRPQLSGEELTIENIVENYRYAQDGTTPALTYLPTLQQSLLLSPLIPIDDPEAPGEPEDPKGPEDPKDPDVPKDPDSPEESPAPSKVPQPSQSPDPDKEPDSGQTEPNEEDDEDSHASQTPAPTQPKQDSQSQADITAYLRREPPAPSETPLPQPSPDIEADDEAEDSVLSLYLSTRARKLQLSCRTMELLCGRDNVHYLLGIDDSSSGDNIQTSEAALLRGYLGDNDLLYSSLDGLAQAALSQLFMAEYSTSPPRISVTYLGDGRDKVQSYNCHTPSEMVVQAIAYCGGELVTEEPQLQAVVLTASDTVQAQDQTTLQLVELLNENESKQIPTIFIDLTQKTDARRNQMLYDLTHLGMLLAYSGKPEMPNSVIMGISQGLSRYQALCMPDFLTKKAQQSHLANLSSALLKKFSFSDDAYHPTYQSLVSQLVNPLNFGRLEADTVEQVQDFLYQQVKLAAVSLLKNLRAGNFITSLAPYTLSGITKAELTDCRYPWLRHMEIHCEFSITYGRAKDTGTFCPGYVQGATQTTFDPDADLTREQAVKLVISAAGQPVDETAATFPDVADWAKPYAAAAQSMGYVSGYPDGTFRGSATINRAEFVTILANYLRKNGITLPKKQTVSFTDVDRPLGPESPWYAESVYLLADSGIVTGYTDGTFGPQQNITRAEAVVMLNRLFRPGSERIAGLFTVPRFTDCTDGWQYPHLQAASISHFAKK